MDWIGLAGRKKDKLLEDLAALVKINSTRDDSTSDPSKGSPYGKGPREALTSFLDMAGSRGFKTVDYDGYAGRVEYGQGEEIVGVIAHLDTVPAGEGWITDPFSLVIKDGRLHGRGVIDNKGPALAVLTAMELVRNMVPKPKRQVHLILGCDEESGMSCIKHYKSVVKDYPTIGMTPDNTFPVVYGEKGIMRFRVSGPAKSIILNLNGGLRPNVVPGTARAELMLGPRSPEAIAGSLDCYLKENGITGAISFEGDKAEVEVNGISCHAQSPGEGKNAVAYLLEWIAAAFKDNFACLAAALCMDWRGSGLGVDMYGKYMKELTANLGVMSVTKGCFDMVFDVRYPNDITGEELGKRIDGKISIINDDWRVEIISDTVPLFMDPESSFIKQLEGIYRDITGDMDTPLQTTGGGTYARLFDNHVAFGPIVPKEEKLPPGVGTLHQANEAMELDLLIKLTAIYARAIYELIQ